jgi:hypothetical protein
MPIPFHDAESIDELGSAAYLRLFCISDEPQHWAGCLFLINARGEPLEFVFNRVELLPTILWGAGSARSAATRRLIGTLFDAVELTPALIFVSECDATDEVFGANRSVLPDVPDIRVTVPHASVNGGSDDTDARTVTVIWGSRHPNANASRLYDIIVERGLLFEPFARALLGLREVYPEWASLIVG